MPSPPARNVARMLMLLGRSCTSGRSRADRRTPTSDERAGRGGIELVRRIRERNDVAGASRVRHVGGAVVTVRDVAGLGFGEHAVHHLPALRRAVAGPVIRIEQVQVRLLDLGDGGRLRRRRDLLKAGRPDRDPQGSDRSAPRHLPSRPWPCRSFRRLPADSSRSAAWTAGRGRPAPCWRRSPGTVARIRDPREDNRRQAGLAVEVALSETHRRVGALIGRRMNARAA